MPVLAGFPGCTAQQEILLEADGSGQARIEIVLDPVFAAYLVDLTATLGSADSETSLFDLELVRATFEQEPGLTLLEATSPTPEELSLQVQFDSLSALIAVRDSRLSGAFRFERAQPFSRLVSRVNRRTIENLVALAGIDPFVSESLLPPEGDMSASEYRDYLVWALEEYEQDRPIATVVNQSEIETRVTPAGEIIEVRGGRRAGAAVVYRTSLLEAVTTRTPLEYSLVFAP